MDPAKSLFPVGKRGLRHTSGASGVFPLSISAGTNGVGVGRSAAGKALAGGGETMEGVTSTSFLHASPLAQRKLEACATSIFWSSSQEILTRQHFCTESSDLEKIALWIFDLDVQKRMAWDSKRASCDSSLDSAWPCTPVYYRCGRNAERIISS